MLYGDQQIMVALLSRLNRNQLALGAAVEELAIWIDQRGSTDVSGRAMEHLEELAANADFISEALLTLMDSAQDKHQDDS
ncbi:MULTISPECIES: hypothetical protein [Pseudomonas]|uniref:Uncharacterized protein n=1 Tax=Pseudomonas luteola TaxID=47886 RepID=A0A2X2CG86_PSELU|nr:MULTISPECIES: hypothetical protein [Pseudomonas]ENA29995.1 hypothetical protein HMPREF1487_08249 [Pseudomonas sp. HPB0071]MBF8643585.1 hypothetical protein [Pseudomonas zeshuii]RRW41232.1 hypothetical protein EGJ50_22935 [Pseudomonas luteola]SHJ66908.1 hypothetical protein SAMN05216295_12165 [Pseudomonas zeshuii]SPZ06384.1 Uncharacterised protein [Pseudomonas luteola]